MGGGRSGEAEFDPRNCGKARRVTNSQGDCPAGGRRFVGARFAASLAGCLAAAATVFAIAFAAPALGEPSTAADPADAYVVSTVTPNGTKVNLFDYWAFGGAKTNDYWRTEDGIKQNVSGKDKDENYINDPTLKEMTLNEGINKDHELKFSRGFNVDGFELNQLNDSKLMADMFASSLVGGYPELNAGKHLADGNKVSLDVEKDESLAYLFNSDTTVEGKAAHLNVGGLFQVKNGYYTYDSLENFASYDKASNSFKVYNAPAIYPTHSKNMGQFFPFNTAVDVFKKSGDGYETADGKLVAREDLSATGAKAPNNYEDRNADVTVNHFFGMSMSTRFMQPAGGTVDEKGKVPMSYHFSGDDDALFYIDDILVGNLGGIHSALSFDIDFKTGEVSFYRLEDNGNKKTKVAEPTTLKAIFEKAYKDGLVSEEYMATNFKGDSSTFADNTIHDLKFFYLERGNLDSNLSLKFNLAEVPETEVVKVDQDGAGIEGVKFNMYAAEKDANTGEYTKVALGDKSAVTPIASGTTDANGGLILHLANGMPINYDDIYVKYKIENYILEEVAVPEGYRFTTGETSPQIKLKYLHSNPDPSATNEKVKGYIVDDGGSAENSTAWKTASLLPAASFCRRPRTCMHLRMALTERKEAI